MARVPDAAGGGIQRYSSPQVREQIARPVLQNANTGSTLADSIQKIGGTFVDASLKMKKEADDVAALEAKTLLAQEENRLLYDPANGAFNKRGKNSFGTIEEVNAAYDKRFSEISDTLVNDQQKLNLRNAYNASKIDINRQLSRHVGAQTQVYDTETTKSSLEVEQNAVATNPLDNERRTQSIIKQRIAIDQYSERMGLPADARQLMLQEAENKTNLGAISSLVDSKDYINAKKYYDDVKETMTGEFRTKADRLVKQSSLDGESQAFTDDVMARGLTMSQSFAEANKIQDPELRKATVAQIRDQFSQRREAENYNEDQLNKKIASQIDRGVLWSNIPQSQKDLLSSSQRSALESYAAERSKGRDVPSGSKLYYDTYSIATNPTTRDAFKTMNLHTELYGKVSKSEFDELYKLQNGLRNGTSKDIEKADQLFTNKQIAEGIARSNGIYAANDDSKSKQAEYLQFQSAVNRGVQLFEQNSGKKATADDVKRISESWLIEKKINNDWFGNKSRRFEAPGDANIDIEFQDIPADEVAQIKRAAASQRVALDDAAILDIYLRRISGKK